MNFQAENTDRDLRGRLQAKLRAFGFDEASADLLGVATYDEAEIGVTSACPCLATGVFFRLMSLRPVRKLVGIGNVFLGAELVDIAEYDLEIYEENPEDHEHHGANWKPGAKTIKGTVVGELPIRKDLRLLTEEGYSLTFYLRDSFGSVVIVDPMRDSAGNPVG